MPYEALATYEFSAGSTAKFELQKPIPEGPYRLRIFYLDASRSGQQGDDIAVTLQRDKPLHLSQNADGRFRSGQEVNMLVHLVQKYKEHDWRQQVTALEQLIDLARRDPSVVDRLREMVEGTDQAASILAAFALSQNCDHQN